MDRPIGIFDSGLGGLTAFKELARLLPYEDIVYFGDTGRVPYGSRSLETITKYAIQDINFLNSLGIKMILIACGTVSSLIPSFAENINVPFAGVVSPTVVAAYEASKTKRIGVIGTSVTIKSLSYKIHLEQLDRSVHVIQKDCPMFVPLVENGFALQDSKIVDLAVQHYLQDIRDSNVDTLILGCTHYPLLSMSIRKFMGDGVTLIDSGREAAIYTAKLLRESNLDCKCERPPRYKFFVSDTPDSFSSTAKIFLNRDIISDVTQIDIEQF